MNGKKLCICIPTYNRDKAIERVLEEEIKIMKKYQIDIIIFDSSENERTKKKVQNYYAKKYKNLFYYKFAKDIPSNIKVYKIFKMMAETDYEYIWLIHDHTVCNENAVRNILYYLNENIDFYVLDMQADDYGCLIFDDITDFLYEGAWRLNSFGASIVKRDTFLRGVDWKRISRKYNRKRTINYSHIGFYYERAAELENFRACKIYLNRKDFLDFQRTEKTSWSKETVRICLECWGSVIMQLPDVYFNKIETLRTQDKWFVSKYALLSYKRHHTYGIREFIKYSKWIKLIYPEDYVQDMMIAILPYAISKHIFNRELLSKISKARKRKKAIYIYGAGRHAVECESFLRDCGIEIDGFIVTDLNGNPSYLNGYTVYMASNKLREKNALVIIAVLTSGVPGVVRMINSISGSKKTDILIFGK